LRQDTVNVDDGRFAFSSTGELPLILTLEPLTGATVGEHDDGDEHGPKLRGAWEWSPGTAV
jgi:hypothetical protein